MKKTVSALFCIILSALLVFNSTAFAAVFTFETQREHENADIAWLTDLVVKEDTETVDGLAKHTVLTAVPDEPYTATPESFKKEVEEYCALYSLKEGSEKAGLIYLFDLLGSDNGLYSVGASDQDIKEYLQGNGVTYPASLSSDELIMARALYLAMITGAFSSSDFISNGADVALEQALVSYVSSVSGIDKGSLYEWLPEGSVLSLDEYILAASRLSLWTSGYDVTVNTPENEVYRLVAVMTIEKMGISVDKSLPFNELKLIYTAALLGKKYGVTVNEQKLEQALSDNTTAFYMLQLIGQQKAGLSIRAENSSFEDAFYSVAENTSIFGVESDEFYADIYKYELRLSSARSVIWIYPTAYVTGNSEAKLTVTANGMPIKNNFFSSVQLDTSRSSQDITVKVSCLLNGETSECTYVITVYQGADGNGKNDAPSGSEPSTIATSDSIVSGIFESLGVNTNISSLIGDFYTTLTPGLKKVISFIAPTFDGESSAETENNDDPEIRTDDYYIAVLDKIGSMVDSEIFGIGGASLTDNYSADVFSFDFITFG